jgi:hypothetical protein
MAIVLADNTPRIEYTVAQGVTRTDPYPIPFAFFNKEDANNCDVKVFVDGVERTLGSSSTTEFSILSGGNGAKGSLSTVVTGASGGSTVIVLRDTKIGRTTDFPSGGAFEVSKLNTELDTLVAIEGDFEDHVSRSIRLQDKDTAVSLALPLKADRLGKQLGFHATTGAVQMFTPESLAIASDSGTSSVDLTSNTFTFTGGEGIDTSISNQTLTITGELASTSNKGVASFNSTNFTVSSGAVTANDITLASDSGSATNTLGETFTLSGGTGLNTSATGSTVTMNVNAAQTGITSLLATDIKIGEDDQTKIDFETADQINFYANNVNVVQLSNTNSGDAVFTVPTSDKDFVIKGNDGGSTITALTIDMSNSGDASFNNNVTVGGNLTVNGSSTTVNTATLTVEDPLISLASGNNSADSVDVGFYGLYDTTGSQDLYAGLFRDASDSGKFKLFKDLQVEPTTTVNTSGTGYAVGTLVANLEGTIQTAAQTNITSLGTLTGLTVSGTITLSGTTSPLIKLTGNHTTSDITIIRASGDGIGGAGTFGFDIKYMGSRSGNNNSYSLFMHNQTGTHVEAMTVFQDGKVGINQTTPTAPLHVGDTALFDDDVTFTGTSGNIVFDKSSDILKFDDSVNAMFGTGNDFRIFHASGASVIRDQNSNPIYLQTDGTFFVTKNNAAETMAKFISDGGVELYHNNGKKFETTSTGSRVYGNFIAEDGYVGFGDSSSDNWGKIEFVSGAITDFTSEFSNAVAIKNEQGSLNQQLYLMDTSVDDSRDIFGISQGSNGIFAITGQGHLVFKRPQGNTSYDITIACPTPSASVTVTLPDSTGTLIADDGSGNIALGDNKELQFGDGSDLIIRHESSGSHSVIRESGAGTLFIDASDLQLRSGDFQKYAVFTLNGSAELYYDNVKKFETTSTGATVTGTLVADGVTLGDGELITLGTDSDATITHDGSNLIIDSNTGTTFYHGGQHQFKNQFGSETHALFQSNGAVILYYDNELRFRTTSTGIDVLADDADGSSDNTANIRIIAEGTNEILTLRSNDGVGSYIIRNGSSHGQHLFQSFNGSSTTNLLRLTTTGHTLHQNLTLESTDDGASDDPTLVLYRNSSSPADNDDIGQIILRGRNDNSQDVDYVRLYVDTYDVSDGNESGQVVLKNMLYGTEETVFSTAYGHLYLYHNITLTQGKYLRFEGSTPDNNELVLTVTDPTADRTVTLQDATGTVALTSQLSDIRDKKDVEDLQLGLDFVNAMRPVQFTWDRRDGSYNDVKELGFIAQELDQVERQFDTKERTKLVTEMSEDELHVSPMNSYPILVKAIQELSAQVESLQARVKELEG